MSKPASVKLLKRMSTNLLVSDPIRPTCLICDEDEFCEIQHIEVKQSFETVVKKETNTLFVAGQQERTLSRMIKDFLNTIDSRQKPSMISCSIDIIEDDLEDNTITGHSVAMGVALNGEELSELLGIPTVVLLSGFYGAKNVARKTIRDMRAQNRKAIEYRDLKGLTKYDSSALVRTSDLSEIVSREVMSEDWLKSVKTTALSSDEHSDLIRDLMSSKRANPRVEVGAITRVNVGRFKKQGIVDDNYVKEIGQWVHDIQDTAHKKRGKQDVAPKLIFINATELGGGVAEMRPDIVSLFRDLGLEADWLVIDGCSNFYKSTVHIHEAIQNPSFAPLNNKDYEILELVAIHNFNRMHNEKLFENVDAIIIDDPQPLCMLPLLRILHPNISILWRCHIHADPEASVRIFISSILEGKLLPDRDHILYTYLRQLGIDVDTLIPSDLRAHGAIFHSELFASGLNLKDIPIHLFGPAVNPISYKNIPLSRSFMCATLYKLGILSSDNPNTPIPPIVMQVSRYDPFKGPFEVLVAFINSITKLLSSKNENDKKTAKSAHFVYASNVPGDNPTGVRLHRLATEFCDAILKKLGISDLAKRIHILSLSDERREESLLKTILKIEKYGIENVSKAKLEMMEYRDEPRDDMIQGMISVGLISEKTGKYIMESPEVNGVKFTPSQTKTIVETLEATHRTRTSMKRAATGYLSGREMNHLEINTIQTAAICRIQFSCKEGFGLVVSEAMIKYNPEFPGVIIATKVGGIQTQVKEEHGIPLEYPPKEAADSLDMYANLPESISIEYASNLYQRIISRHSVAHCGDAIAKVLLMPSEDRRKLNIAARDYVLNHFATHSNVLAIAKALLSTLKRE